MNEQLVSISSEKSVRDTADSLTKFIGQNGLRVFARIDHTANATEAGL